MASGAIEGKLLGLMVDGEFTTCEVSCSIRVSNQLLDASGENNGNWVHNIEGYKSWQMSVNARLMINSSPAGFSQIFKKNLLAQQQYEVVIANRISDDIPEFIIRGMARIQDLDMNALSDSKADYSITFIGNGPFTEVDFEEFFTIINAMPAYADKPNIVDTTQWN